MDNDGNDQYKAAEQAPTVFTMVSPPSDVGVGFIRPGSMRVRRIEPLQQNNPDEVRLPIVGKIIYLSLKDTAYGSVNLLFSLSISCIY
ncbi:MAG: hypothetical protein WBC45_04425 [Atribacterota bacterium]